jgi:hypothetical protein
MRLIGVRLNASPRAAQTAALESGDEWEHRRFRFFVRIGAFQLIVFTCEVSSGPHTSPFIGPRRPKDSTLKAYFFVVNL